MATIADSLGVFMTKRPIRGGEIFPLTNPNEEVRHERPDVSTVATKAKWQLTGSLENHGFDGKGVSRLHDTVGLVVLVVKDVGVGVKHHSDAVATCQHINRGVTSSGVVRGGRTHGM